MSSLRLLLLTLLLPLCASGEMLLTSSWTTNWVGDEAPDNFAIGQDYTVTVSYDESAAPVSSYDSLVDRYYWTFEDSSLEITLSIPDADFELTLSCVISLSTGDDTKLEFFGYYLDENTISWVQIYLVIYDKDGLLASLIESESLPTDISQLPSLASMALGAYSEFSFNVGASTGAYSDDYLPYESFESSSTGPTVPIDSSITQGEIDTSTASLTLEQVPEPSTWAVPGGLLALGVGVLARRRRA